jgi:translation initiation factor 1 (eIF-1/SUI1)
MSSKVVAAFAVLLWVPSAYASSVTNRDDQDHTVTVIEGHKTQDHVLKPTASLKGICQKGCVVRLNGSENDEYELQGSDIVSIEDGYLYYDGPPASAVPKAGDADQPTEPGVQ